MSDNRMTMPFPEATMAEIVRPAIVEFIGTFALIFMGAGSIIVTGGNDLVAVAFAHGLAIRLKAAGRWATSPRGGTL